MNIDKQTVTPVRGVMVYAVLGGLVLASYWVLSPFLVPLTWAAILVYITWPLYRRLRDLLRGSTALAALILTLMLSALFVLPAIWIGRVLADEVGVAYRLLAATLAQGPLVLPDFISAIPGVGAWLQDNLPRPTGDPAQLRNEIVQWAGHFSGDLARVAGGVGRNLVLLSLALLIAFFLYRDGELFVAQLRTVLRRFTGEQVAGYLDAVGIAVKAVIYGLLLTAMLQGVLAGIGYWMFGVQAPILFGLLTALVALFPFGTPLVWGALGIGLILSGQLWAGVGLLLWGGLVVSSIDNFVRPLLISSATRVPFLMVLLGVLGGVTAFGLLGLVIGPVLLAVLTAVWREWVEHGAADLRPGGPT